MTLPVLNFTNITSENNPNQLTLSFLVSVFSHDKSVMHQVGGKITIGPYCSLDEMDFQYLSSLRAKHTKDKKGVNEIAASSISESEWLQIEEDTKTKIFHSEFLVELQGKVNDFFNDENSTSDVKELFLCD